MKRQVRCADLLFAILTVSLPCVAQTPQPSSSGNAKSVFGGEVRRASWEKHKTMERTSPYEHLQWKRLGPKFAGGRVESIDAPAGDSGTIYVGVGAGGVWKTVNGGLTWEPIFEKESTFAIGDITISPSDPEIVWVGTGEAHLNSTPYLGTGVFKSTNSGRTWENMGLHESAHIGKVCIDPVDPDIVYVAAIGPRRGGQGQRGIYKTTDGGQTFRRVLFVDDYVRFMDLVIDPNDRNRLYAASWDPREHKQSGVFRSTDAGETWDRLSGGLPEREVGRVAIDVSRSQSGVVYALIVDHSPPGGGRDGVGGVLFRSDDGGDSWKRTHEDYVPTYVGWDFCDVRVSPTDADKVYVPLSRKQPLER